MFKESRKNVLPAANLDNILETYIDILKSYQNFQDKNSIYGSYKMNARKLEVLFPLREHPNHGITGIHAVEKYGDNGFVIRYHYQWKRIIPKEGIVFSHISAWENEPHANKHTPAKFVVKTDPHHHHHIPGDRNERTENYNIRSLEAVFEFVAHYIRTQTEYKP